jgi:hypothetical protein
VNVPEWAQASGADILWNIPPEKLNDDRLGRSLDAFFNERHSILAHLAAAVSREFGVSLSEVHYDPTHILFQGAYENSQPRLGVIHDDQVRSDAQLEPAHITKGRGTDDAPQGALMVHAGICTTVDQWGPLPFFGHTVDGNQNGHTAVAEQFSLLMKHLRPKKLTLFSDRGTFSTGLLHRLWDEDFHAVCSVPWGDYQALFDQHRETLTWERVTFLSQEQQRRRTAQSKLPLEHYELAVVEHQFLDSKNKERPVPGRVIFVFSTADQKVVRQQRGKQLEKLQQGMAKLQQSVARGNPKTDPISVARRIAKLCGKKDTAKYLTWKMLPLTEAEQKDLPPRNRGCRQVTHRLVFQFDEQALQQAQSYDGFPQWR